MSIENAQAAQAAKRAVATHSTPRDIFAALAGDQLAQGYAVAQLYELGRQLDALELLALGAPIEQVYAVASPMFCDSASAAMSGTCRREYHADPAGWRQLAEARQPQGMLPESDTTLEELLEEMARQAL